MYNNCKNIAQQTIRFLASVLENINLKINILYSNFQQLYRPISNYGIKPDRSYFISGGKLYKIILIDKKENESFIIITIYKYCFYFSKANLNKYFE